MSSTRRLPSKIAQSVVSAGVFGNAMTAMLAATARRKRSMSGEPPRFLERHGQEISEKVKLARPREPDQRRDLIANPLGRFARVRAAP